MSKSSTVTHRESPVRKMDMAASGAFVIHGEDLGVITTERVQIVDLTDRVMAHVRASGVTEGVLSLWSMHTTCTLFINEAHAALTSDILRFLEDFAARDKYYQHNDPDHSDCDRQNADSHLRAMMLGHSLTLQISGGEAVLGKWQRVLLGELDGARTRTLRAQVMGIR